jgi:hypothetical protein
VNDPEWPFTINTSNEDVVAVRATGERKQPTSLEHMLRAYFSTKLREQMLPLVGLNWPPPGWKTGGLERVDEGGSSPDPTFT